MFSRIQQITLLLFGLLAVFSYACTEARFQSPRENGEGPWIGRRGLEAPKRGIVKRETGVAHGRGVCSSSAPVSGQPSKRDLHKFSKRALAAFPTDPAGQDSFMVDHTKAATSVIVHPKKGVDRDINTAFFHKFKPFEPFSLEVSNLKGCGVVVVASKKAVYFAHLWELESFPAELGQDDGPVDDFDGRVTKLLNDGLKDGGDVDNPPKNFQEGLKGHLGDFKDVDNLSPFIIMSQFDDVLPDEEDVEKQGKVLYQASQDKMAAQLKDLLGIDAVPVTYRVDGTGNRDLSGVAEGKVLFEYDPDGPEGGNGQPAFRLIVERKEFFTQTVVKAADCICTENLCNFDCCASKTCAS